MKGLISKNAANRAVTRPETAQTLNPAPPPPPPPPPPTERR
jgi:hypothetical protein